MTVVDLLAQPIRTLLDSVGDGSGRHHDAVDTLNRSTSEMQRLARQLDSATADTARAWRGDAADAATAHLQRQRRHLDHLADDNRRIATGVEQAHAAVADAARELRTILDSFVGVADSMGPALYTPPGLAAIVPVAVTHARRALEVVTRTRTRLAEISAGLNKVGRRPAPAAAAPRSRSVARPSAAASAVSAPATAIGNWAASVRPAGLDSPAATISAAAHTPGGTSVDGQVPITLPDGSVAYAPNQRAATAVQAALSQRGVPYVWGGTTPGQGLDCSGLTQYAYRQAGVELPRLAQDQDTAGFRVDASELMPGDLAVWSGHVAMFIGNGQMVEAGDPVQVSPLRTTNLDQEFEGFYRPR
ncbi:C40 family peptidase [Williamsia sp. CHRR-6]|uniref:C40 family peptidase n=1 Tax=Williamsia sp. CHRR-6 TaxID=2835871 RepID=UPI001BDB2D7F|nr:C40 family peptidase [Williamsia sp. CHRR-6]MBT0566828.1 C40 family peptidase [Williamsia sp. CHRR-6]